MNQKSNDFHVTVNVTKIFSIKPQKVFDAWLDTDMLSNWMFGPDVRDEKIIKLENNPQVGGRFSYVVKRGGKEIDHTGTYREVHRPNRLVFSWGTGKESEDESVVTIDIEPTENGCKLTLIHTLNPEWKEYVDRTRQSWIFMLDKLQITIVE